MSETLGVHGELERFYERWNDAFDRRDADGFVALYAADARLMPPGSPALVGRNAIRGYLLASFFAAEVKSSEMRSAPLVEAGDFLVDIGTYSITFGGGVEMAGNYLTMFQPLDAGGLEACYDIFSPSDSPA